MSEDVHEAARDRRSSELSENAKSAAAAFDTADDVFTTCQVCMKPATARKLNGVWAIVADHDCDP